MAIISEIITDQYAIYNTDCMEILQKIPSDSVHLSIYSPPFATERGGALYNYSSSDRDLSNCDNYEDFFKQYEFYVEQIARITLPGRISCVHCMDVPKKGANICGYTDFPGDIIRLYDRMGFEYMPRISIWKEPLEVRNRTMSKALAHRQIVEDSTQTNCAAADYLIPFRKRGENKIPVVHPLGLKDYAGERTIPADLYKWKDWVGNQIENRYSHWIWRQYASCIWDDIRISNVLPFRESKDEEDEKHVHPLQLDVIERCIVLYSNPGEIVLTPFMGVGSEVYQAVKMGRKGIGIELKPSYYRQTIANLKTLNNPEVEQLPLFGEEEH